MNKSAAAAPPTGGEYSDALQNPRFSLRDRELRAGRLATTRLGMPKVITGNFASVFQIDCGHRQYALRCFTRRLTGQQERYQLISAHLATLATPWKVSFEFLPDEVLVHGRRHPALKMEWVQATTLIDYVERHLDDREALRRLAERFVETVADLERSGIAHGDLQHGNILVSRGGALRLVDYDGMYVPGLEKHGAVEVGHRNYQSPLRTISHFGPTMDRFAAWVIYTSLVAVTIDPGLWHRLQAGDERLLIGRADLELGGTGRALDELRRSRHRQLSRLGILLQELATIEPDSLPALTPEALPPTATAAQPAVAVQSPRPEQQHADRVGVKAGWVPGHLPVAAPVAPPTPGQVARLAPLILIALLAVTATLPAAGAAVVTAVALAVVETATAVGVELILFWQTDHWREKSARAVKLRAVRHEAKVARRSRSRAEADMHRIERDERRATDDQNALEEQARKREQSQLRRVDQDLRRRLEHLARRRQTLQRAEEAAVADHLNAYRAALHVRWLQQISIRHARLKGFDQELLARLEWHGFITAADFAGFSLTTTGGRYARPLALLHHGRGMVVRVPGIGEVRARRLDAWRRQVEAQIIAGLPHALPSDEERAIRDRFRNERAALGRQEQEARVEANQRSVTIRQELQARLGEIAAGARARQQSLAQTRAETDRRLSEAEREAADRDWELAMAERELLPYRRVTYRSWLRRVITG